jgi:hypothetical protein
MSSCLVVVVCPLARLVGMCRRQHWVMTRPIWPLFGLVPVAGCEDHRGPIRGHRRGLDGRFPPPRHMTSSLLRGPDHRLLCKPHI